MPVTHLLALTLAIAATVTDLRSRRIPNPLTLGGAVVALLAHLALSGPRGAMFAAAGWVVGLVLFLLPFALGGMGGGDVKLLAALGAWLGPSDAMWLALYTGVAGGILAIVVALAKGYLRTALSNVALLLTHWRVAGVRPLDELTLERSGAPKLAYALPILVGTVVTIWLH
jgi:prepilin peptidase CpaA